ncbi:MAG TPA: squalene synthase HpnC [Actinomycetes bacterium]|nr:squalene synthase HpnC [Actinomycetes bacterium]
MDQPEAVMAKAANENFPVAPLLLPRAVRRHLLAVYGFARLVDDLGDEAPGDRLAQLDLIERDLDRIWANGAALQPSHPLLVEVAATVRAFGIPPEPFHRLIQANRQDQTVSRYQRFEDLVAYCELSANPVGHLVLHVFQAVTPARVALSDAICTALQLTEHWQDVAEDLARDRVYLPEEDLARFGVDHRELAAPRAGERVRRLMEFQVARTAALFDQGAPLVGTLRGRARLTIAGFLAGGRAALAAIAGSGYDVLSMSPKPTRRRLARELSSILLRKG